MTDRCLPVTSRRPRPFRQKRSGLLAAALALFLAAAHPARAALFGDWIADNYSTAGTTWADSSGNGHTATTIGVTSLSLSTGAFGTHKGINFAGGNGTGALGYFTVTNAAPLVGATSLTLVAVMRPTAAGTGGANFYNTAGLIGNEQSGTVNDWALGFGNGQADAGIGGASNDKTITSGALTLNTSYVEIATWDATTGSLKLYINGTQVAQTTTSTAARDATGTFALGADTALNNGDLHIFTGQVAELQIYTDLQNVSTLSSTLAAKYGVVPEPSTWLGGLACVGLSLCALCRRWRARA